MAWKPERAVAEMSVAGSKPLSTGGGTAVDSSLPAHRNECLVEVIHSPLLLRCEE